MYGTLLRKYELLIEWSYAKKWNVDQLTAANGQIPFLKGYLTSYIRKIKGAALLHKSL